MNIDIKEFIKDCEYLINTDSPSNYPKGVGLIGDFFIDRFDLLDWNTQLVDLNEEIGLCLIATNTSDDEYDVIILGHMDTVFDVGEAKKRPMRIE